MPPSQKKEAEEDSERISHPFSNSATEEIMGLQKLAIEFYMFGG